MNETESKPVLYYNSDKIEPNKTVEGFLIGAIEDFRKENYRYPKEVIFNKELAQYYFDHYVQGEHVPVMYKGKQMSFTVNIRLKASKLFMR